MEKHIRKILLHMTTVVVALVILGVWQFEFIWHGIEHNIWVNSAIFLTIIGGCILAFVNVAKLKNEIVAFKALQEMWQDARDGPERATLDPLWRHYRCVEPGVVFQRPKILGHVYDLVTEEIARTKKFAISIETMQTLVHKIDVKLAEEKSLLSYMAGLLVFMGLIGTFMGLLKMVGSIGGILAGLETMSAGGNGGDAFGSLMSQLQQPLGGMATGFASSLFGLFGSLVVGLLGRYAHQAASQLKVEFESWLAAVAQIDTHGAAGHAAGGLSHADSGKMIKLLTDISASSAKAARAMESAVVFLEKLSHDQEALAGSVRAVEHRMEATAGFQEVLFGELRQLHPVIPGMSEIGAEMRNASERVSQRLDHGLRSITETTGHLAEKLDIRQSELMDQLADRQAAMLKGLSAELARLQSQRDVAGGTTDPRLAEMLAGLQRTLADTRLTASVDLSRVETLVADGLAEISRSMEAAFQAFAQVSRLAGADEPAIDENDLSDFFPDDGQTTEQAQPTIAAGAFAEALARRAAANR